LPSRCVRKEELLVAKELPQEDARNCNSHEQLIILRHVHTLPSFAQWPVQAARREEELFFRDARPSARLDDLDGDDDGHDDDDRKDACGSRAV
jgi:hypothetical protein